VSAPDPQPRSPLLRLLLGAALALALPLLPGVRDLDPLARRAASITVLTAWCWITEALPLAVGALLPAILLPAAGVASARQIAPWYFDDILFLFLGGFILSTALERTRLHERLAWRAVAFFGSRPRRLVLGMMAATAALSLFVNNTSATLVMLPVGLALLARCEPDERAQLGAPLLLGIAYGATIGGIATPIGTAPNILFLAMFQERFPEAPVPGFGTWMLAVLPLSILFLLICWQLLVRVAGRPGAASSPALTRYAQEAARLPPRSAEQNRVLIVFSLVVLAWLTREPADLGFARVPGWKEALPAPIAASVSDATVALIGAVLLFVIPSAGRGSRRLLVWDDCRNLPWGVLLLIGGGLALAKSFEQSGLSAAVAGGLGGALDVLPMAAVVLLVSASVTLLTEIASNTATINVLLPLLFGAAVAAGLNPLLVAIPAVLSVSYGFALPVGTPPNAIVFATGRVRMNQMLRVGILLNLIAILLVTLFTLFWTGPRLGFDLRTMPGWAAAEPAGP